MSPGWCWGEGGGGRREVLVKVRVELRPDEDAEEDDIKPKEERDACAEGAVDLSVVGEAGDVPAEGEGGEEPGEV